MRRWERGDGVMMLNGEVAFSKPWRRDSSEHCKYLGALIMTRGSIMVVLRVRRKTVGWEYACCMLVWTLKSALDKGGTQQLLAGVVVELGV